MLLQGAAHQQQTAVLRLELEALPWQPKRSQLESPHCPEADRSNGRMRTQFRLVIGVPTH